MQSSAIRSVMLSSALAATGLEYGVAAKLADLGQGGLHLFVEQVTVQFVPAQDKVPDQ